MESPSESRADKRKQRPGSSKLFGVNGKRMSMARVSDRQIGKWQSQKIWAFRTQGLRGRDLGPLLAECLHLTGKENGLVGQKNKSWHELPGAQCRVLGFFSWRGQVCTCTSSLSYLLFSLPRPFFPEVATWLFLISLKFSLKFQFLNEVFSDYLINNYKFLPAPPYSLISFPAFPPIAFITVKDTMYLSKLLNFYCLFLLLSINSSVWVSIRKSFSSLFTAVTC